MPNGRRDAFFKRDIDWFVVLALVGVAILCHGRYVFDPTLLFATEGDSFRQILPTSILYQNALCAGDPFWSWSFGLGGDLFTELSYAGTTSIFTYLQSFVRALTGAAGGSDLIAALRWKLAFSVFKQALALTLMYALLRREGIRRAYAIIGALVYGCAPWFLYRAIQFDFMTDAYAWLPLTALAFARYRRTGRWILLAAAIALSIGTNLYFGYICCIFYATMFLLFSAARFDRRADAAVLCGQVCKTESAGIPYPLQRPGFCGYAQRVGKLAAIALAGALLAAAALLPSANAILSSDRTVANAQLVWLPRLTDLRGAFITLFGGNGMLALPLCCLLAFTLRHQKLAGETKRRTLLAVLWAGLLFIPATSSVMNGFSYETPRWQFVVIFAVAYALPYWLAELEAGHARIRPWAVWTLCGVLCALYAIFGDHTASLAGLAWGIGFAASLFCVPWVAFRARIVQRPRLARIWTQALCGLVLIGCVLNCLGVRVHNLYADDAQESFFGPEAEYAANRALVPQAGAFYRVHDMGVDVHAEDVEARPFVYGTYGVSNYASELNGRMSTWHKKTFRFRTTPVCAGIYQSFDNRLFAELAWNVRYKVPLPGTESDLPSNWRRVEWSNGASAYESDLSTGFALWYDTALGEHAWKEAGTAERDALLLQTAALADEYAQAYPAPQLDEATTYLPQTFADAQVVGGAWTSDGKLAVPDEATLTWRVAPPDGEGEYLMCFSVEETSGEAAFTVTAAGRSMDKFADTLASESLNYPLTDYAFRFGGAARTLSMTLTKGVYKLWDLQIAFNSYAYVADWVAARSRHAFQTLSIAGSRIDGTIAVESPGVLALSMPASPGWRCTVDGAKTELLTVNGIFAGIALSPGTHTVCLRYTPPFLVLGACVTLGTAAALGVVCVFAARRKKRATESHRDA